MRAIAKGGFIMATCSFDTVVRINNKSAKSFESILNNVQHKTVDLHSKASVTKMNATDIETFIQNKKKISAKSDI
jgi:hypothetical protein